MTSETEPLLPAIRASDEAAFLKVRAAPGAREDRIAGIHGDALKVTVRARPEKGKANRAIAQLLASALDVTPSRISLHSGASSRDKWYRIDGVDTARVRAVLANLLQNG